MSSLAVENEAMGLCSKNLDLVPHISSQCMTVMPADQKRTSEGWERSYEIINSQRKSLLAVTLSHGD